MWSGPRNISTALMRSWEARGDTAIWDEPLYGYYLRRSGIEHPGRAEIIAAGENDWRVVTARCAGPVPNGKRIFYQKHMTQHVLPELDREWLLALRNCFLIRDPREVIASYARTRPEVTADNVGMARQAELFEWLAARAASPPPIIDSADVMRDPSGMLARLCDALDVEYSVKMLHWTPGPHDGDGVWGKYWYASVWRSTGFTPYVARETRLSERLERIAAECDAPYQALYARRLRV